MADESDLRRVLTDNRSAVARKLERERRKPVGEPMSSDEARRLTDQIRRDTESLWDKVVEAYLGRAYVALGYESWDTYCITEIGSLRLRLPREERREAVCSLRDSGLSIRAMESATGVSAKTIQADLKARVGNSHTSPDEVVDAEVDEDALAEELIAAEPIRPRVTEQRTTTEPIRLTLITGLDRKRYPPSKPKPPPGPAEQLAEPPPPSDAETFDGGLDELDRMVDVMTWLINRGQLDKD